LERRPSDGFSGCFFDWSIGEWLLSTLVIVPLLNIKKRCASISSVFHVEIFCSPIKLIRSFIWFEKRLTNLKRKRQRTNAIKSWGFSGLGKIEAVGKFIGIFNFRRQKLPRLIAWRYVELAQHKKWMKMK